MTSTQETDTSLAQSFKELFPEGLVLKNITETLGFEKPTPIQQNTIPHVLAGRDVYAGARTGSGKTMAFLAPIAQLMTEEKIKKALVLCPTRELALQIDEEAMKIFEGQKEYVSCPLYGGVPLDQQLRGLQLHKPRLFIATPGRMIDFIQEGCLPLADIEVVVLDEADRMCDMGFSDQVEEILQTIPYKKQSLMFSATLPKEANVIMQKYLNNPVKLQLDDPLRASQTITHRAVFIDKRERMKKLRSFIEQPNQTIVIFTRTRKQADRLYDQLRSDYSQVGILHAGFSMGERERTIRAFRDAKIQFLVATDVAARGLDIERITKVIHYDLPDSPDDYIHRSGRSGRAGRDGETIALIDKDNFAQRRLMQELKKQINFVEDGEKEESGQSAPAKPQDDKGKKDMPRSQSSRRTERSPTKRQGAGGNSRPSTKAASKPAGGASSLLKKAQGLIGKLFGKTSAPKKNSDPKTAADGSEKPRRSRNRGGRRKNSAGRPQGQGQGQGSGGGGQQRRSGSRRPRRPRSTSRD